MKSVRRFRSVRGFSTPETAAVLAALSVLTATAGPNLQEFVETARMTKARGDIRVLTVSFVRLSNDIGAMVGGPDRTNRPQLLVGPGEAPGVALLEAAPWARPAEDPRVGTFTSHLVTNDAGYPVSRVGLRWRGPYLESISADPWGSRYALNLEHARAGSGALAVIISPGPDGIVETPFTTMRLEPSGDDLVGLVSTGR